jgi:spore coat-associated protein N
MKKILIISMACVLCLGLIGGAFAYFTDTETSTGNSFTAGYMDLQINGLDTPPTIITLSDMAPGHETSLYTITFNNNGNLPGTISYNVAITGEPTEPDTLRPDTHGVNVSADAFASEVYVTYLVWGTDDILAYVKSYADTNTDGNLSLKELAAYGWFTDTTETLAVGHSKTVGYKFTLNSLVTDEYQGDGVVMSVTGKLTSN